MHGITTRLSRGKHHHHRFRRRAPAAAAVLALTAAGMVAAAGPAMAANSATVNGGTTFQTITGFGASEGFGQASTVMNASSSVQQQALNGLYGSSGAGLTILRNEISADSGTTIEPNAPSSPSATPSYLPLSSINSDQGQLWFAQAIKADFGVTNVFADAWSAPAFMKTNNSTSNGGAVCGVSGASCASGNWIQAYANYLKQYAADYAAAGIPLSYIGPENEANLSTSYDSMQLSPAQTVNILDALGPAMASSGLSTKVECCATEGWNYAQQYAPAIEADPTANADTAVFTSHGYTAAPNSPLSGWSKPAWQTEWSTFESWDPAWDDGTDASGLTWAQNIFNGLDNANLSAFLYWWGSTTPSENGDNEGLIEINGSTVIPSGRLWAFGNFSRFVRPGAVRLGATTSDSNLTLDAFKNTDNTVAVVALNTGQSPDPVSFSLTSTGVANGAVVTPYLTSSSSDVAAQPPVTVSGGAFSYTLPARSLVTFTVPAPGGGNRVTVTSPGNQTSTVGKAASVQIAASDSAPGQTLAYSATGLPAGLSINSATGLISGTPATAGTSTVTVTATDGTGAAGSTSFTWTVNPTSGGGACQVSYTPDNWAGGFTANITITNTGPAPVNGWTLKFTFPGDEKITNAWNGSASQNGENVSITNVSYNATIAAGGFTSLGFQGTWTTSDAAPTAFTVNGSACTT
jgi:O-glycosyl hydrolase